MSRPEKHARKNNSADQTKGSIIGNLEKRAYVTWSRATKRHMIRKGQACGSAAGAKVGLLYRFIIGMFGIEA